jgi:transposase
VKTNRRDARKLAGFLRAGLLTEVCPPTAAEEAVRDLCRARDDARSDLLRSRHRLGKLLLRRGLIYHGRNWTKRHREWLDQLSWPHVAERHVVRDYRLAISHNSARITEVDRLLEDLASQPPYGAAAAALRCFRGVDTVTAMTILAELHEVRRFPRAPALMAFVGLVPSEDSTGDRRRLGAVTKMGNGLVRRLLIQAAWHYRHEPRLAAPVQRRRAGQPLAVLAIAESGAAPVSTLPAVVCATKAKTARDHGGRPRAHTPDRRTMLPAEDEARSEDRRPPHAIRPQRPNSRFETARPRDGSLP